MALTLLLIMNLTTLPGPAGAQFSLTPPPTPHPSPPNSSQHTLPSTPTPPPLSPSYLICLAAIVWGYLIGDDGAGAVSLLWRSAPTTSQYAYSVGANAYIPRVISAVWRREESVAYIFEMLAGQKREVGGLVFRRVRGEASVVPGLEPAAATIALGMHRGLCSAAGNLFYAEVRAIAMQETAATILSPKTSRAEHSAAAAAAFAEKEAAAAALT
ncbi:hypothetical protein FIBSPDRAFT_944012 [Athelia psychrophila]|uniref:Uncharacterized protein n=1 Tax=Athelia psychrophila TaxID=1759441 RepID=A0A166V8I3_9AGAM|nr:hypothetical protein FIBSPDRAFT_944012 [Fibularhizoctonia sp. CBS 109695]